MSGSRESGSDWPSADRHASAPSLAAFAEGALPPNEMRSIAAHVAGCDECAERVAAYADVDELVRTAPAPIPPAALRADLYARIGAAGARQASNGHLATEVELTVREIEPSKIPSADTPENLSVSSHPSTRPTISAIPSIARWGGAVAAALIVALLASVFITLGQSRTGASARDPSRPRRSRRSRPRPSCHSPPARPISFRRLYPRVRSSTTSP